MKKTIEILNELKSKGLIKDYAVGGGIGALKWTEPFFTQDLDIFIISIRKVKRDELIVLTPIYDYLKKRGYQWKGQWIIIEETPVDFIPAEGIEQEAIENAIETDFEGTKTKVMTPEYLIALFLKAGRNKDLLKIEMLLSQTEIDLKKLGQILREYGLDEKFKSLKKKYKK